MTPSTDSSTAERTLRKRENTRARLIEAVIIGLSTPTDAGDA